MRCMGCPQKYNCNKFSRNRFYNSFAYNNMQNIPEQENNQVKQNFSQSKGYQKINETTAEKSNDAISVLSDIAFNFEKMSKNFTEQNNLLKENLISMKSEIQDIKEKFNNDLFVANKNNEVEVEIITPEENKENKKNKNNGAENNTNEISIYNKDSIPVLKEKKTIFGKKWVEEKQ